MEIILLILIFIRPFICSLVFFALNYVYSVSLLTLLIFWIIYKGLPFIKLKSLKFPLILFSFALILSALLSRHNVNSFDELCKYAGGLTLFVIAASFTNKTRGRLTAVITLAALIISILAIYQYAFGFKSLVTYITKQKITDTFVLDCVEQKRVFFPFVTPNLLGGYIAMIIPLSLSYKYKILFILPLAVALMLTKSVGALLAIYLSLTVYFYAAGKFKKKEILLLLGVLFIMGLIYALRTTVQKEHMQPLFSTLARMNYWEGALRIIKKSPIIGVGLGNFNLPQSRYAHNSYLQIWAEMGILGIISFLWLIVSILKISFKNLRNSPDRAKIAAFIASSVAFLIHNFVEFSFFLPEVAILWWLITGLLLSFPQKETAQQ